MSTFKDFCASIQGLKVDFGCGPDITDESFLGFDGRKQKHPKFVKGDFTDPEDSELVKLRGTVLFAVCRHAVCCVHRSNAPQVLKNIFDSLVPGGYFLLADFDLRKIFEAAVQNNPDVLGPMFSKWYGGMPHHTHFSDLLNVGMRGINGTEIKWRYCQDSMKALLQEVGFQNVEYIALNDPRATGDFTHTRPNEDMVFFCQKPVQVS